MMEGLTEYFNRVLMNRMGLTSWLIEFKYLGKKGKGAELPDGTTKTAGVYESVVRYAAAFMSEY